MTSSALDCDVISRTWTEQVSHGDGVWRSSFLSSFMGSLCRVRNKIMYGLSWQTVYALTRVLFWCLFPSLLRNSGNKHQNNPSWAHKQFATWVHTLFSMYFSYLCGQCVTLGYCKYQHIDLNPAFYGRNGSKYQYCWPNFSQEKHTCQTGRRSAFHQSGWIEKIILSVKYKEILQ